MILNRKTILLFILPLTGILFSHCKNEQQGVPYVYVNLTVYVNDPQNIALTTIGGWKYFPGGYNGLLVYRKSQGEFMVYDRACPVHPDEAGTQIEVDSSNIILKDDVCGSQFLFSDGSTIGGPSVVPLTHYATTFDGTTLRVAN
jgi:nitrite reductase/ring-hydroxylating ferredoxin subunit